MQASLYASINEEITADALEGKLSFMDIFTTEDLASDSETFRFFPRMEAS